MPKQLKELKNFINGITSNIHPTDMDSEAASYSLNINSNSALGIMEGVKKDTVLSDIGFVSNATGTAISIEANFENFVGDWGGGISALISILPQKVQMLQMMTDLRDINNEISHNLNEAVGYMPLTAGGQLLPTYTQPLPSFPGGVIGHFFDNNGTLQTVRIMDNSFPGFPINTEHFGIFISNYILTENFALLRETNSSITSTTPIYAPNESWPTNKDIVTPWNCVLQLHLDGEEWFFVLNDLDTSSTVPTPLEGGKVIESLKPDTLTGIPFNSNVFGDNVNIVNINVDMSAKRLPTQEDIMITYLDAIVNTINNSDKGTASYVNQTLTITPSNPDGFNYAKSLSKTEEKATISLDIQSTPFSFSSSNFKTIPDVVNRNLTNIISVNNDNINSIEYITDIFNGAPSKSILSENFNSTEIDMSVNDNKVFIGAGPNLNTPPKVAMQVKSNEMLGISSDEFRLEDFSLDTFQRPTLEGAAGESVIFQIYGQEADNNGGILFDNEGESGADIDSGSSTYPAISEMDWDFLYSANELATTAGNAYLHEYLTDNNVQEGQIIKIASAGYDTADNAFVLWKKYDYGETLANSTDPADTESGDLFMYCGDSSDTASRYPVLRFVGKQRPTGGIPSFSYTFSKNSNRIHKTSLIETNGHNEATVFSGGNIGTVRQYNNTETAQIKNVGSRVTTIDIVSFLDAQLFGSTVSALSPCTTPLLFNNWQYPGNSSSSNTPFNHANSNLFRSNGNLKYISRHGIFWLAIEGNAVSTSVMYRINLIDFHQLTSSGIQTQEINLSFDNLPTKLANNYTESDWDAHPSGEGCININIADQEYENNHSESSQYTGNLQIDADQDKVPQEHPWSAVPQNAKIIGICETYECGRITDINDNPFIHNAPTGLNAHEFTARPCDTSLTTDNSGSEKDNSAFGNFNTVKWSIRLTTGDKIMITGLDAETEAMRKFNIPSEGPHEVNMVDTNKFMISAPAGSTPSLHADNVSENKSLWWNSKVWVLYAKKSLEDSFNRWDLFLYNANTLDVNLLEPQLKMADRTPPYSECGHHTTNEGEHFYYPRQFAHMMSTSFPNQADTVPAIDTISYDETNGTDIGPKNFFPNGWKNNNTLGTGGFNQEHRSPLAASWGIYDKGGRWTVDGGLPFVHGHYWGRSEIGSNEAYLYNETKPCIWPWDGQSHYSRNSHVNSFGNNLALAVTSIFGQNNDATSNNGSIVDYNCQDDENNFDVTVANETSGNNHPGHAFHTNGNLFWGNNLGWDSRNVRAIKPVTHSLHPLSHYSRCFLAGRHYRGSNGLDLETFNLPRHSVSFLGNLSGNFIKQPNVIKRDGGDEALLRPFKPQNQDPFSTGAEGSNYRHMGEYYEENLGTSSDSIESYNDNLTLFQLDEWTGHPGIVYRNYNQGDYPSVTDFGVVRARPNFGGPEIENPNFKPWVRFGANDIHTSDMTEITNLEDLGTGLNDHWEAQDPGKIEKYNLNQHPFNNLTGELFGGDGPAYLSNAGEFHNLSENQLNDGTGCSNRYHAHEQRMNWTHSSTNRGYVEEDRPWTDKGWGGYAPPSLFNPGKGYYVFINRTWKTASQRTVLHNESNGFEPVYSRPNSGVKILGFENGVRTREAMGWKFQWFELPHDGLTQNPTTTYKGSKHQTSGQTIQGTAHESGRRQELSANRWNNFSSTAIADASWLDYGPDSTCSRAAFGFSVQRIDINESQSLTGSNQPLASFAGHRYGGWCQIEELQDPGDTTLFPHGQYDLTQPHFGSGATESEYHDLHEIWYQGINKEWVANKYMARSFKYNNDGTPTHITDNHGNIQFHLEVEPVNVNFDGTPTGISNEDAYLNPESTHPVEFQNRKIAQEKFDCVFKTGTGYVMGPVCTFHKLPDEDINNINSVFPTVLNTKRSTTDVNYNDTSFDAAQANWQTNRYLPSYIISYKSNLENPGLMILTSDLTAILAKDAKRNRASIQEALDYNGKFKESSFFINRQLFRNDRWRDFITDITGEPQGNYGWSSSNKLYLEHSMALGNTPFTNYFNRNSYQLENIALTEGTHVIQNNNITTPIKLRLIAKKEYVNQSVSNNIRAFDKQPTMVLTEDGIVANPSTSPSDSIDMWYSASSSDELKSYLIQSNTIFDLEGVGEPIPGSNDLAIAGNTGGTFSVNLLDGPNSSQIKVDSDTALIIELGSEDSNGSIPGGGVTHQYKITLEYDGAHQSALQDFPAYIKETDDNIAFYNHIQLTIRLSSDYLSSISKRVTGVGIWKTTGADVAFSLVDIVPFDINKWTLDNSGFYNFNIFDKGVSATYSTWTGISEDLQDTSLHYGLSAIYKGYMFLSHVWHPDLSNIERYIFRSIPGNYFRYDWATEKIVIPEVPIAMTSFNGRLYVWGQNKLYKVDPINLIIEDEYEGISIASRHSFVSTEFGLCFLDKNNIYLHDGNKPNPIGNAILSNAIPPTDFNNNIVQSGYKELVQQTLDNGDSPNVFYLNKESSFAINLSNSDLEGRVLLYNILSKRWDISDTPRPRFVTSSTDGAVLLTDGELLYNIATADDKKYHTYARKEWTWNSKNLTMGAETQDKVFLGLNITGTPSYYELTNSQVDEMTHKVGVGYNSLAKNNSIRAYIDGEQVPLEIQKKRYTSTRLQTTVVGEFINEEDEYIVISSNGDGIAPGGNDDLDVYDNTTKQEFIRPGHYIKIFKEIMFVKGITTISNKVTLNVTRNVFQTQQTDLSAGNEIYIIAPRLRIKPADLANTTKLGKTLKIVLEGQRGFVDSIGLIYKTKGIK